MSGLRVVACHSVVRSGHGPGVWIGGQIHVCRSVPIAVVSLILDKKTHCVKTSPTFELEYRTNDVPHESLDSFKSSITSMSEFEFNVL